VPRLLGMAARSAKHLEKLTARFEILKDFVTATAVITHEGGGDTVTETIVIQARYYAVDGPLRLMVRVFAGRLSVINVERQVDLGDPIQQKGRMVLQGYLTGCIAKRFPLSFNCSITFEQNYGGVEGDSASMAELVAILSEFSGSPGYCDHWIGQSIVPVPGYGRRPRQDRRVLPVLRGTWWVERNARRGHLARERKEPGAAR
jgi:hypothetical protein